MRTFVVILIKMSLTTLYTIYFTFVVFLRKNERNVSKKEGYFIKKPSGHHHGKPEGKQ